MSDQSAIEQRNKWIVRTILLFVVLAILVVIALELRTVWRHRRTAQLAVDAAVLAGTRQLGRYFHDPSSTNDREIKAIMNDFAERNEIQDTDGIPGNDVNQNLVGYYLDADGNRLGTVGSSSPDGALGIEVIVYSTAPTFLTKIAGLDGWPVEAVAQLHIACDEEGNCAIRFDPPPR